MPSAELFGCRHFGTVSWHLMVNDALSARVPIVAVNQLPISTVVVGKGGTIKLFASPARNSQSATARLFVLFL